MPWPRLGGRPREGIAGESSQHKPPCRPYIDDVVDLVPDDAARFGTAITHPHGIRRAVVDRAPHHWAFLLLRLVVILAMVLVALMALPKAAVALAVALTLR